MQDYVMRCMVCEKDMFDGDLVLFDDSFKKFPLCMCKDCFDELSKEDLVEHLGAYWGSVRGF